MDAPTTMNSNLPQFLVAKYVPDPLRMEPRNIGVILWHAGTVSARFVGENPHSPDKLHPPRKLFDADSRHAYRQWIKYWRHQLERGCITSQDGRTRIDRGSPDFLTELQASSKSQFMLVSGGFLNEKISPVEVSNATDELFEKLVEEPTAGDHDKVANAQMKSNSIALRKGIRKAVNTSRIRERMGFFEHYSWFCPIEGSTEKLSFEFDFAIHRVKPISLFQHVLIHRQESVNNAVFMFHNMARFQGVNVEHCGALIHSTSEDLNDSKIRSSIAAMRSCARVIDVSDDQQAARILTEMAS